MSAYEIPKEVLAIAEKLESAGYEAYLVGGCVRDMLMGSTPKDWDIATNAKPEEILKLFPDSVYENQFGTVGVKSEPRINADQNADKRGSSRIKKISVDQRGNPRESALNVIEVTTFRLEGKYTDKRHPDEIKFAKTIEEDLGRRDFMVNAMALRVNTNPQMHTNATNKRGLIDPFSGQKDLEAKLIRAVGDPEKRFSEDALRLMRAVRFAVQLNFSIERKTESAIKKHAGLLEMIAKERIRDEFIKIIMTPRAKQGIELLEELGLLKYIVPELREGIGVGQNKHHIYTVWEHNLRALDYAVSENYSLEIRLASLLHDVGKPKTKAGDGPDSTFYNHDIVGAKMAAKALDRLVFPKDITEKVAHLVRFHLFYYNVGEVSEAGVRRFIRRVGPEYIDDLLKIREADRIGSGVPKAVPYKLRHLQFMIEKVKADPISPKMLKVNGEEVMEILGIPPGPKVGQILGVLLEEVIDEPQKNTKENLESRIKDLGKLSEKELVNMAKQAKEKKEEFESGVEEEMKRKYYVK